MERIPFPVLAGDFVTAYRPKGDLYRGNDTKYFRTNTEYESWTVNDFSILNDNGTWHLVGITHPTPPNFTDEYTPIPSPHDGEHMLFHATARGTVMKDLLRDDIFEDLPKILYPADRPDEIAACHAPHLYKDGRGGFDILYGPRGFRLANTKDFRFFSRRTLFEDDPSARDPFVFEEDGTHYVIYAVKNRIDYRTTRDFKTFSEAKVLQVNPWCGEGDSGACSESPYLFKRKGFYYLMWAIYDGRAGIYDHRTFLFGARTWEELANSAPLTMLPAHAGEIYSDESGDYLLSAFYPENGINIAPLRWEND
jgi:hypothetical protein